MREIKFRVWVTKDQVMSPSATVIDLVRTGIKYREPSLSFIQSLESGESILMQYTGLKDKNGVGIYEGDKLRTAPFTICEVIFRNGSFVGKDLVGMYANGKNRYKPLTDGHGEIIGNIYKNPGELLK